MRRGLAPRNTKRPPGSPAVVDLRGGGQPCLAKRCSRHSLVNERDLRSWPSLPRGSGPSLRCTSAEYALPQRAIPPSNSTAMMPKVHCQNPVVDAAAHANPPASRSRPNSVPTNFSSLLLNFCAGWPGFRDSLVFAMVNCVTKLIRRGKFRPTGECGPAVADKGGTADLQTGERIRLGATSTLLMTPGDHLRKRAPAFPYRTDECSCLPK